MLFLAADSTGVQHERAQTSMYKRVPDKPCCASAFVLMK